MRVVKLFLNRYSYSLLLLLATPPTRYSSYSLLLLLAPPPTRSSSYSLLLLLATPPTVCLILTKLCIRHLRANMQKNCGTDIQNCDFKIVENFFLNFKCGLGLWNSLNCIPALTFGRRFL